MPMKCTIVSHTHWDREWYRAFQAFRAKLVDAVDQLLDLLESDPGYRFLLDGQSVVIEDYLEIRPQRRPQLARAIAAGRIAIGPWYVQPDSLLPSGESHIRNLLEGRRVASEFGAPSTVAYTPDSFGHPSQFPQLFAGFGLKAFVYWRGNDQRSADLSIPFRWKSPDGSEIPAFHLRCGYFNCSQLPEDPKEAGTRLAKMARKLEAAGSGEQVLLMNGIDHEPPDPHIGAAARELARETGWDVERGLLDDYVDAHLPPRDDHCGELVGGRDAPLLPGVWSTRSYLKLRNRACEQLLEAWAEPWSALGNLLGVADEGSALRLAWRSLLVNQAHDSICGCSIDAVHDQMMGRYDAAQELADQTTSRVLSRIAGGRTDRRWPWTDTLQVAVFNPSPRPRTDVVRLALDPEPAFRINARNPETGASGFGIHPVRAVTAGGRGFAVDGVPTRMLEALDSSRFRLSPDWKDYDLEFVASDIPAMGFRVFELEPCDLPQVEADGEREIRAGAISVRARDDGRLDVEFGSLHFRGLCALEDVGDRGDTYDFDPVPGEFQSRVESIRRVRHPDGTGELRIEHLLDIPELNRERDGRGPDTRRVRVCVDARVHPDIERVDLEIRIDNEARDHRLRLLFPTGAPAPRFRAATTFDVATRTPGRPDDRGWRQPAPDTFPHQGFVEANGLMVVAPGLPEAQVTEDGVIAITALRSVGWLSRPDLASRPEPAGPALETPGAQCPGPWKARVSLRAGGSMAAARDCEMGLRAAIAGPHPLFPQGHPLLSLEPAALVLSALKPASDGSGIVVRVLNPSDEPQLGTLKLAFPFSRATPVNLDETPNASAIAQDEASLQGDTLRFRLAPHALYSLRITA